MVEVRDGTWEVGEAGCVTFIADEDAIRLVSVHPREGWSPEVVREQPDRLSVEFSRGRDERELEVRYRHGVLRVEIESEDEAAQPGRFTVGNAGEVEIAVDDGRLRLVEVGTNPGWSMEVDEESGREVKVDFRQGELEWEFEAELSRRGRLDVEIEMEVEGPYPLPAPATT